MKDERQYQVTWTWFDGNNVMVTDVMATTAERAISKVRREQDVARKSDIVILEAYKI